MRFTQGLGVPSLGAAGAETPAVVALVPDADVGALVFGEVARFPHLEALLDGARRDPNAAHQNRPS